jgi:peptidoglycan/LPS O-acetylase OafA/YrhL
MHSRAGVIGSEAPQGVGSADSHVIRYRADLDGLRAIAVWSVIVYHLSHSALAGGYLGVDMFFVLSGYLITSIIWREQQQGRFSVVRFYDRRVRRIMPALLALLAFTTVLAAILLLPTDLIGYGKSLLATLGFVANIYFWRDTNYFSQLAATKPLLHLWSLGVEEQFYIFFPLLLALVNRIYRKAAFGLVTGLTLVSLVADIELRAHGGSSPAFFLLPTRAWELGIGAMLALAPERAVLRGWAAEATGTAGALILGIGLVTGVSGPLMPAALPTTLGAGMLVFAGRERPPFLNRMIAGRPMVYFGLISYSLYLWHWPLIVFATYYLARDLGAVEIGLLLVGLLGLAHLSWRYVERPFRDRAMPIAKVRWSAGLTAAGFAALAVILILTKGLPARLNGAAATINAAVGSEYRCPVAKMLAFGASRGCAMNLPSGAAEDAQIVLLGNSHAQMYAPVIGPILAARNLTGLLVPLNGCLPTLIVNTKSACFHQARANLSAVLGLSHARYVIVALTWPGRLADAQGRDFIDPGHRALIAALDDLIGRLECGGKHVILVGPLAEPGWDVPSILSRDLAFGHKVVHPLFTPAAMFYRTFAPALRHFEARRDIGFARPDLVQCNALRCNYLMDGHSLFADTNHIAAAEAPRFRKIFEAVLPGANARVTQSSATQSPVPR